MMTSPRFWFESLRNWQSDLSLLAMVVFSIYLRQKGSPESKPVESPHRGRIVVASSSRAAVLLTLL